MSEDKKIQTDCSGGLDALFRKTLGNSQMEPSPDLWKGINQKLLLTELVHFNFTNVPKAFWIGAGGAALIGLIFLFNQIPDGKTVENDYNPVIVNNGQHKTSSSASDKTKILTPSNSSQSGNANLSSQTSGKGLPVNNSQPNTTIPVLASNNTTRIKSTIKIADKISVPTESESPTQSNAEQPATESHLIVTQERRSDDYKLNYLSPLTVASLLPVTEEDTMLRIQNLNGILNVPLVTKTEIPKFFTYNIGVSPELSLYRNNGQYSESNLWLKTGLTYHIGKFSLQTGVGLGYVFDQANYRVRYKSKDSIGYFTDIISFIITPGNNIIYTTKDIAVYDSIEHVADNRAISRYTYLQIPLLLGYEVFESDRWSIGIKAGPAISFLIASKEAAPFIDYPNAQLIRVENNSFSRVKMNWELQAALDIEYRLTKNFSIYADPSYNHYFKPFETQESATSKAKDPYSIGIELGIRVNFGQNKKFHD
jgi:Outer membrane protein beta-barrel domain